MSSVSVSVSDPQQKQDTAFSRKYTSYLLSSSSSSASGATNETVNQVRRRYRDFLWLHRTLQKKNSGCIIPPLPKKQFLGRFHPDFIENRMRGIEKFLDKVLSHPVLKQELYVHTFLETEDITQACNIANSCGHQEESGVMDWLETKKNVLTASESKMVKSQTMIETEERLAPVFEHLNDAMKHAPKAAGSLERIIKQYANEEGLLQKRADACEAAYLVTQNSSNAEIVSLKEFSASEQISSSILKSHVHELKIQVSEPFQRYSSTVMALRNSVNTQRNKRANHVAANSAIQRDSVRNPDHEELVAKAGKCFNEYIEASNRLLDDFNRYQREREEEVILLLQAMAGLEIKNCQNRQTVWTDLEKALKEDKPVSFAPNISGFSSPPSATDKGRSLLDLQEDAYLEERDSEVESV